MSEESRLYCGCRVISTGDRPKFHRSFERFFVGTIHKKTLSAFNRTLSTAERKR